MPKHDATVNYVFTDGEIISFNVNYQTPVGREFTTSATVTIKAKRALTNNKFEYCFMEMTFHSVSSFHITESFRRETGFSEITLKKLDNGNFYVSLHPFNNLNEPHELDNFVIQAESFTIALPEE